MNPHYFGSWIRIRVRLKSWIRICVFIKAEIQKIEKLSSGRRGPWRSQWRSGGYKWSPGRSVDQWSQILITLIRSRILFRIRIKVKGWIWISIKVTVWIRIRIEVRSWIRTRISEMRIRNPYDVMLNLLTCSYCRWERWMRGQRN